MSFDCKIAVLIPCYNEEMTVSKVVADFKNALPEAEIYVFDNNSTDNTVAEAKISGANVGYANIQGKGNVIRRMFSDIDAHIYLLVDGDATYSAASAQNMINHLVEHNLDMVVAKRNATTSLAYRGGHVFGNKVLTESVSRLFGRSFSDILSGYRVFSRRFVKSFPAISTGFEIETELTVHALELRMPIAEVETPYFAREEGSESKLNSYRDGIRILSTILNLYRLEKPIYFFGLVGSLFFISAMLIAYPILVTYMQSGLVPRLPSAVLATGLCIVGTLCFFCGLILDTVTRGRHEFKRLIYLQTK